MTNHRHHLFASAFFALIITGWAVSMSILSLQDNSINKDTRKMIVIFPSASPEQTIQKLRLAGVRLIDDIGSDFGFHGKAWLIYAEGPGLRDRLSARGAITLPSQWGITLPGTGGCLPLRDSETIAM